MKALKIFGILFFLVQFVRAQDYNVLLIPDSLKEHADAVVRFEETRIIINMRLIIYIGTH